MTQPRILTLDIETAPAKAWVWGLFDQNIGLNQLIEPGRTIMVGAKWLGESKFLQWDEYKHGPANMFRSAHRLLSEADAVVTYNGNSFDLPRLNGAFISYRLPPLPPVASIDLLKTVRQCGLQSNKLEYAAKFFKIGEKIKNEGFPLWSSWMTKDRAAMGRMRTYNKGDVTLTESFYRFLRPYITNHPYLGSPVKKGRAEFECRHCGAVNKRHQHRGEHRSKTTVTERIQCLECGGWNTGKRKRI